MRWLRPSPQVPLSRQAFGLGVGKNSFSDYSGRRHLECGAFLNDSLNVIDFILCMCMQP
jgi:hypothetical protein